MIYEKMFAVALVAMFLLFVIVSIVNVRRYANHKRRQAAVKKPDWKPERLSLKKGGVRRW